MRAVLFFVLALGVSLLQAELWQASVYGPDLRVLMLAFLLTRVSRPGLVLRLLGWGLGCAAGSLEPVGLWCAGVGLSALMVLPLRPLLFVQNPVTQVLATALTLGAFVVLRMVVTWLGVAPTVHDTALWISYGLTVALSPVLHAVLMTLLRWLPGPGLPVLPSDDLVHRARTRMP